MRVGLVLPSGNKIPENDIFSVKFDSHLSDEPSSVGDEIEFGITVEDKCWPKW